MMIGTWLLLAKLSADVEARAVGQADVEQDEVGISAGGRLQRLGGGAGDRGVEPLALESLREGLGDRPLVLDEQDRLTLGRDLHSDLRLGMAAETD